MTTLSQPHAHPRVTIGAVGAAPNANGATLTGQALVLELASTSFPGLITAAEKTKLNNLSGTNTGDVTLGAFGATPNANGLSLVNQVLNMQPASATNPGGVSTGAQTFAGSKTFNDTVNLGVGSGNAMVVASQGRIAWASGRYIQPNEATGDLFLASFGVYASGKVKAATGLGCGNSAAASTPGTVTKKMEVFDMDGVSLGFVAIYNAIT